MKRLFFAAFVFVLVSAFSAAAYGQPARRITFKRGGTTAVVTGTLRGYRSRRVFLIKVREGQTINARQTAGKPISVWIKDPMGEMVGDMDLSCHNDREITPTVAGDYRLEVVECEKADRWYGKFRLSVTVR